MLPVVSSPGGMATPGGGQADVDDCISTLDVVDGEFVYATFLIFYLLPLRGMATPGGGRAGLGSISNLQLVWKVCSFMQNFLLCRK